MRIVVSPMRFGAAACLALGCLMARVPSALAIDCAKAREPIEQAICGDPLARASDDAMGAAFRALLGALSGPAKQAALDDQRGWLARRNASCLKASDPPAACARRHNAERAGMLAGRAESGPGLEPGLLPQFILQAPGRDRVGVRAQYYRFAEPRNAGERLVNAEADRAAAAIESTKSEPDDVTWTFNEVWSIRYASPAFLSIWTERDDFSGGAHGNYSASGLNIDLRAGRLLAFPDLFEGKAVTQIARLCLRDIEARAGERLEDVDEAARETRIASGVTDLSRWSFTEREARIHFGIGTLGDTYIAGAYECVLPTAQLDRLAKAPLPPR